MAYPQPRIFPGEWNAQKSQGFWDTSGSPNLVQTTRLCDSQPNKEREPADFAVPADNWIKLTESEKRDEYLDLARGLKKTMEHENDGDTNCNWYHRHLRRLAVSQNPGKTIS